MRETGRNVCVLGRDARAEARDPGARAVTELAANLAAAGHTVSLLTNLRDDTQAPPAQVTVRPLAPVELGERWSSLAPTADLAELRHAAAVLHELERMHEEERAIDAVVVPSRGSEGSLCGLGPGVPLYAWDPASAASPPGTFEELAGCPALVPAIGSGDALRAHIEARFALSPGAAAELTAELLETPMARAQRARERLLAVTADPLQPPPGPPHRVTAVVLTRNRPGFLARALASLEPSTAVAETIVIDNGSADRGAERIAEVCAAASRVRLERSERDLGCAGGRQRGVELAETELVMFVDDDAELLPGALPALIATLDEDRSALAVTATVVLPDGTVQYSGGALRRAGEQAWFTLLDAGRRLGEDELAPSGRADWVPGGALLARRELLREIPIDAGMRAYFEDNEWSLRVNAAYPAGLRRSREALVLHHLQSRTVVGPGWLARAAAADRLAACARIHAVHGLLLMPALTQLVPGLEGIDGELDVDAAHLLMELVSAKGPAWTRAAWMAGRLDGLITARRIGQQLALTEHALAAITADAVALHEDLVARRAEMSELRRREAVLRRIEAGGWWRLRGRLLPLLRPLGRARGWLRGERTAARGAPAPGPERAARPIEDGPRA